MNYLLEINAFERRMRGHPLPTTAQLLWYKLMQFANRLYWPEWFSIDNDRLTATVNAGSDKTIRMRVDCRVRRRDCVLFVEIEERKPGQIRPAFPHEIRR